MQTSKEIIEQAKQWFKETGEDIQYQPFFIIGCLKQSYDTLLKSISEDTRDKFIAASSYEEMKEEHEGFKEENDNWQHGTLPPVINKIIQSHFNIKTK